MRRRLQPAALALALAALAAPPAAAQAPVDPGARVRVDAPTVDGTFWVVAATRDTLVLQRDSAGPAHRVPVAAIRRLDVSRGRRPPLARFGRGLLIGAGIGAAVGVVSGLASGDDPQGFLSLTAEEKAVAGGVLAGVGGATIGGLVGVLGRGERWERVDTGPRVALVAPPAGRGVGVRLAGAF